MDISTLAVQVKSDGIEDLADGLQNIADNSAKAETSTKALTDATTKSADAASKLLSKQMQQADMLGLNVSQSNAYLMSLRTQDQAFIDVSAALGAQVDEYKALAAAQAEAIRMNNQMDAAARARAKDEADYLRTLQLQVDTIKANSAEKAAAVAASRGYSAETIAQAKSLGAALDDAGEKGVGALAKIGLGTVGAKRELMVLAHETLSGNFSRIPGSFMVLGERAAASGVSILGIGAAIAAVVGVFAGFAYLVNEGAQEQRDFDNSLKMTSNSAGLTSASLQQLSIQYTTVRTTTNAARAAFEDIASYGLYTRSTIEAIGKGAIQMSEMTGESTDKTLKFYDGLAQGASKWALEHNQAIGTMDAKEYELIVTMEKAGKSQEAMAEAVKALTPVIDQNVNELSIWTRGWRAVSNAVSDTFDAISSIGKKSTQIDFTQAEASLKAMQEQMKSDNLMGGTDKNLQNQIDAQASLVEQLRQKMAAEQEAADKQADDARIRKESANAQKEIDILKNQFATNAEKRAEEEANVNMLYGKLKEDAILYGVDTAKIEEDRLKMIQNVREKYKDKKTPGERAAENDAYNQAIAQIQSDAEAAKRELKAAQSANDAAFKAGEIDRVQMIKANADVAVAAYNKEAAAYQRMIDTATGDLNKKAAQQRYGNQIQAAEDNAKQAQIQAQQDVNVELSRLYQENEQNHIKTLEREGQYVAAAAEKNSLLQKQAAAQSFNLGMLMAQEMDGGVAPTKELDMYVQELTEKMRVLQETMKANTIEGQFKEADAQFKTLYDNVKAHITELQDVTDQGGILAKVIADREVKSYEQQQLPLLRQKLDLLKQIQNATPEQTKAIAQADAEVKKMQDDLNKTSALSGAQDALLKYTQSAQNDATLIGGALNSAFSSAENTLTTFLSKGKADFKSFADSIIADLARIAAKKAIASLFGGSGFTEAPNSGGGSSYNGMFSSIFGAVAQYYTGVNLNSVSSYSGQTAESEEMGLAGNSSVGYGESLGQYAEGGTPPMNKVSLVGEKGPELFVPKQSGTIIPNDQIANMMGGTQVNYSPTIHIDSRSDSAQIRTMVSAMVQQGNSQLVEKLNRAGKLRG
jgi:lambda family phage tail tape measure protein